MVIAVWHKLGLWRDSTYAVTQAMAAVLWRFSWLRVRASAPPATSAKGTGFKLREAGAMHLAESWAEVEDFAQGFFQG